jgi:acetyl-CoA carboxylase biotin carboxyl carrier protein
MAKLQVDEGLVRKLSRLLEETGLTEIEYEAAGQRIRVARNGIAAALPATAVAPVLVPTITDDRGDVVPINAVTSPMVGTVYLGSEPDAAPFVSVGANVEKGQTLVIIEAMKVMNQIPSPRAGKVTAILISDGQPVEYGEPLLVIE